MDIKDDKMKGIGAFRRSLFICSLVLLGLVLATAPALAQDKKPNILVIWADDIGRDNISAYTQHRQDCQRRRSVHRLLCGAELHCRPIVFHHRPASVSCGPVKGRHARREAGHQ